MFATTKQSMLRMVNQINFYAFLHPKAWTATLPFMNCMVCMTNDDIATGSFHTTDVDLFDYCKFGKKANHYSKSHIVRFDPNAFLGQIRLVVVLSQI